MSFLVRHSFGYPLDYPLGSSPTGGEPEPDGLSIQVATTRQAVEELRPVWQLWNHGVDTDIDYYLHSLRNDPTILNPYVIAVFKGRVAQTLLVGQVKKQQTSAIISSVRICGPRVRVLEIVSGGRVGVQSSAVDKRLATELLKVIKRGDVDLVCFYRLPLHSQLFHHIQRLPSLLIRDRVPYVFDYSVLSLTASERKLPSLFRGKIRREVRRKARLLQHAFPDKVRFQCFSGSTEMNTGIRDAMTVAVTTWQYRLDGELANVRKIHNTLKFFAQQGWLRIYVLYVEDLPCAYLIGCLYNKAFYCRHAGYCPDFARFSVGSLLTARALEDLAATGVQWVDLGEGRQEHNRRLGCQKSEEGTVHMYSPTLRGLLANTFFAATQIVRFGGRHTESALGLKQISKSWRNLHIVHRREQGE